MKNPVRASDGFTYEEQAIIEWAQAHPTSPMTREPLMMSQLSVDHEAVQLIALFHASESQETS